MSPSKQSLAARLAALLLCLTLMTALLTPVAALAQEAETVRARRLVRDAL